MKIIGIGFVVLIIAITAILVTAPRDIETVQSVSEEINEVEEELAHSRSTAGNSTSPRGV